MGISITFKEHGITTSILQTIIAPIAGANPSGENISFDPEFEQLKAEIGKIGKNDYALIIEKSLALTQSKAKDIRVLLFLSFASLSTDQWEQFVDAYDGLTQLCEKQFDSLYPDKERGRYNAFKWVAEARYSDLVAAKKPTAEHFKHIERLVAALERLKKVLEVKFPQQSPFPSHLLSSSQQWLRMLKAAAPSPSPSSPPPKTDTKPEPTPTDGSSAAPKPGNLPSPPPVQDQQQTDTPATGGTPSADAPKAPTSEPVQSLKEAQVYCRKLALFMIENEPSKSLGFALLRVVRWDGIEKVPPVESGKTTKIEPPTQDRRNYLQNCMTKNEWKKVILTAEQLFASGSYHYWIDLQRICATACKQLGDQYKAVVQTICRESANFMQRVPGLVDMTFSDGLPFCDELTKQWLQSDVAEYAASQSKGAGSSVNTGALDEAYNQEKKAVMELVTAAKTDEAIDTVYTSLQNSTTKRMRFQRNLLLAEVLVSSKNPEIAAAVLESLDDEISHHHLDVWEPELSAAVWKQLLRAYRALSTEKNSEKSGDKTSEKSSGHHVAVAEKQNIILKRLSLVDPKSAIKHKS
ncbi:MAG: type VI secretion system protein TssA [Chitinivibrionales bacterium]|nr:type VI secretion system protein TssA [Chitinivibrionales bacterium]